MFLDPLVLKLTTAQIAEGEKRIADFANGDRATVEPYRDKLVLKGISGSASKRLALINDTSFKRGDKIPIKLGAQYISVQCVEIRSDSVLVKVDSNPELMELKMQ
jgi:hypothetical protein